MKHSIVSSSGLLVMVTSGLLLLSLILSTADAFASVKSAAAVSPHCKGYSSSSQSVGSTSTCLSASTAVAAVASVAAPPTYTLFGLNIKKSIQKKKSHKKQLFTIPSIFNSADSRPIILFDGKCNLCNGGVQLILDNDAASLDPRGNLRVAALQSRVGQILLSRLPRRDQAKVITLDSNNNGNNDSNNNKSNEFKSIVVIGPNSQYWLNSAACLKIGRNLRGPLKYLALLAHLIPSFIRDPIYKLLSKYRKKLFGESAECRLWDDNYDMRYVNDELFGGRGDDSGDPFADPNAPKEEEEVDDEEEVDLTIGPNVKVGDTVRIVSSKAIVHTHVDGYEGNGLCSVGLVGTVSRVLEQRAYPKSVAVQFDNVDCGVGGEGDSSDDSDGGEGGASLSFEAHFYPGQLRKE